MKKLLLASLVVASVAGCRIKGDPTFDAASATCNTVGVPCSENAGCCSFACLGGSCIANTVPGGICRTSDDCIFTMSCVSGRCNPGAICSNNGVGCTSKNACCSGNCVGFDNFISPPVPGTCTVNTAPAVELGGPFVEPYYSTTTLHAAVTDPNPGDTLYYRWDVVSAPSNALLTGWTSSLATPSVFLRAKGTYQFRVTVVDGPATQAGRLSGQDTMTITAVNLPPVVAADPNLLATTVLRNVDFPLFGAVRDPNGDPAMPVSCEWYATPPGGSETQIWSSGGSPCPANPSLTYRTPIASLHGPWAFRLHASDTELDASDVRTITVVNAPPVAFACAYECQTPPGTGLPAIHVGNLGPPGGANPSIPFQGRATDANGDEATAGFTWEWRLDARPGLSQVPLNSILGSGTGAAPAPYAGSLDPDFAGTYVVRLHVDDGRGGAADDTVEVVVEPWIRPLLPIDGYTQLPVGTLVDAGYFHAASAADDRLVYVGATVSGTPTLWDLDPESIQTTFAPSTVVGASGVFMNPSCLGLSLDGGSALVGGDVSGSPRWLRVTLGATPSSAAPNPFGTGWGAAFPTSIADAGGREFAVSSAGVVHTLVNGVGATSNAATCKNGSACTAAAIVGTRAAATTDHLWLLNTLSAPVALRHFLVWPNGDLDSPAYASGLSTPSNLWLSALHGTREVALSSDVTVDATTLSQGASLPFPVRHVDTIAPSGVLQGLAVSTSGAQVEALDASYAAAGTLPIPRVGYLGTGYPGEAVFAFVHSDGNARYVVLRATVAGTVRWYLARY
ncbi:MAG TPA: hypothetical protein VF875_05815 [Anaeromyxobacter sp.]